LNKNKKKEVRQTTYYNIMYRFFGVFLSFAAFLLLSISLSCSSREVKLVILHTNDVHSQIEAFANDHPRHPGMGGFAARAGYVNSVRQNEPNVLLLDAGDVFQGTPYFNFFKGELEFKLMSLMGYDAMTLGNHEFDNGLDELYSAMKHANFSIINSNYNFSQTILAAPIKEYDVFEKDNIRIGVFGLGVKLSGLVSTANYQGLTYDCPIATAKRIVPILRNKEKCDLVICLSHLGLAYDTEQVSDTEVAKQVEGIDIIIGGHTHVRVSEPLYIANGKHETLVVQAGYKGLEIGRIDCYIKK